ncbi:2-dehydro-3-deoxy-D-arabinonate dehydratase [Candidatus Nanopelagicus limnes]|uniref:2-dehydro-3-deoxy-D-arabinonate dehydratase n=1 Tax=Candidatus Nanopelagicus limnae TaxID=1884634 RepID=A0A249JX56_9ACTN|nr:fumarylacetoacetate hydrolase family protein [Candidatus Nanopelagicus limnes]ASY09102.1 2-dehydro-3-deoxy-D-arabinonate dehydratase [Candidatus Nanopelagicus limnes]
MSHLAVIQTPSNPYHLVKEINGKYFEIEKIKNLSDALSLHMADFRKAYDAAGSTEVKGKLVAPVAIDTEVWGAGVTYQRSRDARKEESDIPDVYQLVYEADRPELFFKATARRTVGHEGEVGIRADAQTSVPEPEVAIVMNKFGELIGMSICNDMTSRNIEGENPLYLSQAKIYYGSNALGPMIRPIWEIVDHDKLDIYAKIERAGSIVWQAETSLKSLNRSFDDLIDYLFKCQHFPVGVVLSTGTGIVPPLDISLMAGDVVTIIVDQIGTLVNKVALTPEDINDRIK